jgi:transposase
MKGQLTNEARLRINNTRLKQNNLRFRTEIRELKDIIKAKNKRIASLEAKLQDKESQRKELLTFLYKPKKKRGAFKPRGKKPGSPAYHRPTPREEDVTERTEYILHKCPTCSNPVGNAVDTVVKYEEDIDLTPRPIVKKHTITRHWCSHCETYVKAKNIPDSSRIGINVMGYILYARYRLRLPLGKIKESLQDLYNFSISEGEIVGKLSQTKDLFDKDYDAITLLIQEATKIYSDETGWRMDGHNWWLWVFVTDKGVQYVIEDTRGKGVPENVLGTKTDRVIISDGYAAYQNLPGDKQQCWVHLMRKAKLSSPRLYEDLVLLYKKLLVELEKPVTGRNRRQFEHGLEELIKKKYREPLAVKVQERMTRHKPFLFTCLDYEGVLPENNTAERALRLQVVMRKIFGGSRSLSGAEAHQVNTSVIETMLKRSPNTPFFDVILPLLRKRRSGV